MIVFVVQAFVDYVWRIVLGDAVNDRGESIHRVIFPVFLDFSGCISSHHDIGRVSTHQDIHLIPLSHQDVQSILLLV